MTYSCITLAGNWNSPGGEIPPHDIEELKHLLETDEEPQRYKYEVTISVCLLCVWNVVSTKLILCLL